MSRRVYHKQGPAPLSLCTRNTTASRSISDHKNCGRPCRDKPVLAQKGAGGGDQTRGGAQIVRFWGSRPWQAGEVRSPGGT